MKIVFLLDNDPVFHPEFLNQICLQLDKKKHEILIGIVKTQSPDPGFLGSISDYKKKYIFIGGFKGVLKILKLLSQRRMDNFFKKTEYSLSLKKVCHIYQVPYFKTNDCNGENTKKILKKFNPDLLFSFQGHILKSEILTIAQMASINKHSGLLPKYRGVWPVFWTLLKGEKRCGVTLHLMNDMIDDGDIIAQQNFDIDTDDTVYSLYHKIYQRLPDLVSQVVDGFENKNIVLQENDKKNSTYFSFPKMKDIKELEKNHKRII